MLKEYTCIMCPIGCDIEALIDDRDIIPEIISMDGARCEKGEEFVKQELINPMRNIASSVIVSNGDLPLVSVRLSELIPRHQIFDVMKEIKKIELNAPVEIGQVVIKNILGLNSDVIATKNIKAV